jgi:hypothetical protein
MAALAVGLLAAAFSLPPFYWPVSHVSFHLAHLPGVHSLLHGQDFSLSRQARRLLGFWPFH